MVWSITDLKRRARAAVIVASLALSPLAGGCPVCSANRVDAPPRSSWAMLGTTAAMGVLPFAMLGGFIWWLRKNL